MGDPFAEKVYNQFHQAVKDAKARVKGRLLQSKESELSWFLLVGGQFQGGDVDEGEQRQGGGGHHQVGGGHRY